MNKMKQIDPAKNTLIIGGAIIGGFADGEMISFEADADWYSKSVGGDGDVTRVTGSDRTGKFTVTLEQSSDSNDVLSALLLAGTVVPLLFKDQMGRTTIATTAAWVKKPAAKKITKAKSEAVAWEIDCGQVEGLVIGGN